MNKAKVCYIWDENLIQQCDRLPAVDKRASIVDNLFEAYNLHTKLKVVRSSPATYDDLKDFHSEIYLDHLKKFTTVDEDYMTNEQDEKCGLGYDCPPVSNMFELVTTVAGGSITAAKCLLLGVADVAINWCGGWHHAKRSGAEGFCYVNDIVIAIEKLRKKFPKVLYVDLDVHHGDGVQDAYNISKSVFTLSFHKYEPGFYPGTGSLEDIGSGTGTGYSCNVPLHAGYGDDTLEYLFHKIFNSVYSMFSPDAIVVQCGADALARDALGGARLTERGYCACVRTVLDTHTPTILLGGGGYVSTNAARLWVSLTALAAGITLNKNIPDHYYWLQYSPDYKLHIESTLAKDNNSKSYLDECIATVQGNLEKYLQKTTDSHSCNVSGEVPTTKTITAASQGNFTKDDVKLVNSVEACIQYYTTFPFRYGVTYCNATYDSFLCWPPTEAGATAFQNCPEARLSDTSRLAFRRCGLNGLWLGRRKNETYTLGWTGWTNYTPCFPPEVQNLLEKVYDEESDPQKMFQIAQNTRYMEIIGFSLSLIALLVSLYIFCYFRSLRNFRTKIHLNLFLAMTLQVIVRLVLYLDQAFIRDITDGDPKTLKGLDSLPYVCEACYISLEYGISAMFCWMFIEGLYLHSIVTANALRECITYRQYLLMGWGTPVVLTCIWAVVTSLHYVNTTVQQCWYGYNFLNQYWVCQGPRLAIILINLVFLLNILRVLIGKLNRSEDSEIEKARKAARAALVLLPLLGITNILNMIEAPLDGSEWRFALWSYTTHFLRSFQGLFIALIYCFLNGEVRQLVVKMYRDWQTLRNDTRRMREVSRGGRRQRQSASSIGPLQWMQRVYNNHCTDENTELDDKSIRRLYSNPNMLDKLQTIRCDEETNVTDGV